MVSSAANSPGLEGGGGTRVDSAASTDPHEQRRLQERGGSAEPLRELAMRLGSVDRCLVLTGAGVSTESGIPDYRDDAGQWKHRQPMKFQEFSRSLIARQRYWARSLVGFSRIDEARPNAAHRALARLEESGTCSLLVTQNVDGLHQKAGSKRVLDLHGRLDVVECLGCRAEHSRREFQRRLAQLNPSFSYELARPTPDGDAELGAVDYARFLVPPCTRCGGTLKPGVVFFGESVPTWRVERASEALAASEALLVVGSSLMVFSGYRFARAARQRKIPIYIINRGKTRADELATLKVTLPASEALARLLVELRREPRVS